MTFSSLIDGTVPHHNKYSSRNGKAITRIVQHHWAGLGGGDIRLMTPTEKASATYIIYSDGRIMGQVPEEFQPWTSSSPEADGPSITIEVQNTGTAVNRNDSDPNSWPISNAAYNSIINLLADVARRHKWGGVGAANYRGHREFHSTACPGGYLWSRMAKTRAAAQAIYLSYGVAAQGHITSTTSEEDDMFTPQNGKELTAVVDDADRARNVLDSIEEPLHEKLLRINRFIKGDKDATIYEIDKGYLRPLTSLEWKLMGKSGVDRTFPQADIDKMPKLPVVS